LKIWVKRILKFISMLFLGLVVFYAVARFIVVYTGSEISGARAPYLQMPTSHSMLVRWQTNAEVDGKVRFGTRPDQLDHIVAEKHPETLHSVELDGLSPDTRYYFAVDGLAKNSTSDSSTPRWFRTLPVAGSPRPVRLWVMGDSGDAGPKANEVRDAAMNWIAAHPRPGYPDFDVWLALGDIAYTAGTNKEFQESLFGTYAPQLRDHPLWPVYGNHDDRRWTYFRVFTLPEKGEAGGVPSGTEHYYSFNYGQVHIIVLDSMDSSRAPDGAMAQWLKRDLAQDKSRWRIAAFHHPPYSKGTHNSDNSHDSRGRMTEMRENIVPILEAGGVDLVLNGHSHMYERSYLLDCQYGTSDTFSKAKNVVSDGLNHKNREYIKPIGNPPHTGTVYVVAGSASKVDTGKLDHPALPIDFHETGTLVIDIDGDTLIERFINDKGEVKDHFTIRKEAGYKSPYQGCKK
jgi:acid phosphatase type 7